MTTEDPAAPDATLHPTHDDFQELLAASRAWRGALIPNTSTATSPATSDLLAAVARFDQVCQHPREWRVFHPRTGVPIAGRTSSESETCGFCGAPLPSPSGSSSPAG